MFILDPHIMLRADLADNIVVHCDNATLQTTAKLQIRLTVPKQQHIGGVPANIDNKHSQCFQQLTALRHNCGIGLRIYEDIANHDAHGLIIIDKVDRPVAPEILCEPLTQHTVVLRGQADGKIDLLKRRIRTSCRELLGNGKERQHKIPIVSGFITHVRQALACQRPVFPVIFQNLVRHGRPYSMFRQSGHKRKMRGFDRVISVVNSNQHNDNLLKYSLSNYTACSAHLQHEYALLW